MSQENINRGKLLRQTRRDKGLTMGDVADRLGIPVSAVSDVERGFHTKISSATRTRMEALYQCDDGKKENTPKTAAEELLDLGVPPHRYLSDEERAKDLEEWRTRVRTSIEETQRQKAAEGKATK